MTLTEPVTTLILAGIAGFAISSWSVARIRELELMDEPNARSSHAVPTPRGGGAAISVVTIMGTLAFAFGSGSPSIQAAIGFVVGGLIISVVSFIDDIRSLSASVRLPAQAAAAVVAVMTCGYVNGVNVPEVSHTFGIAGPALTLLWIVGLTNAYNFMDGIDGIAAAQAVVAGVGWAAIGTMSDELSLVYIGILIAATSLGFLRYNWPPATIFMGDVGSAFLGFSLAVLPLLTVGAASRYAIPALLLVWAFVFDTTLTLIRRLARGENIFTAHRSHLYQRLNLSGYSHKWITTLYMLFAVEGAAGAILFLSGTTSVQIGIIAVMVTTGIAFWRFVLAVERSSSRRPPACSSMSSL